MPRTIELNSGQLRPTPQSAELPVSFLEEARLSLEYREPNAIPFNGSACMAFTGELNFSALLSAIQMLIQRHEIFRTAFSRCERSSGAIHKGSSGTLPLFARSIQTAHRVSLPIHNLETLPRIEAEKTYQRIAAELQESRFEYNLPPLLRLALVRMDHREHRLILVAPHLIVDAFSMQIVEGEIRSMYSDFTSGIKPTLPELLRFVDFVTWQRTTLTGDRLRHLANYWIPNMFLFGPLQLKCSDFPFGEPEENSLDSGECEDERLVLGMELCRQLRHFAVEQNVTLYMACMSVFSVLLQRYVRRRAIPIWGYFANRHPRFSNVVGLFANTHMLAADFGDDPSAQNILQRTRTLICEALSHQEIPFPLLLSIAPDIYPNFKNPFSFGTYISFDLRSLKRPPHFVAADGVVIGRLSLPPPRQVTGLTVTILDEGRELTVAARFKKARFHAAGVREFLSNFEDTVEKMTGKPNASVSKFGMLHSA